MSVHEQRTSEREHATADRVLLDTGLVKVGAFRCARDHAAFVDSGPIENFCFVFPRTAVSIHHDHERPFVANPNVVTFYNRADVYRRAAISDEGDRSDWFAVRHDTLLEVARSVDPAVEDRAEQPFRLTHAPSEPRLYALQRRLFTAASGRPRADSLSIDETTLRLLELVLRAAVQQHPRRAASSRTRRHIELAHAAKALISRTFDRSLTLTDLATRLDVSVFHLCRVFRRVTGMTLHAYRHQLRLRWSLEPLLARHDRGVVDCALEAGFSSHSHYAAAFRRAFGQTPSDYIRWCS
jgi:AraC family transcriptional regulator